MNRRHDPDATIRRWLAEGAERAPERALADTIDRLRATDQPRMLVVNLPVPIAAALALALTVALVAGAVLSSAFSTQAPVPTASTLPSAATCSLEIAASGSNGTVFVGRGFAPDTDVVLDVVRADGSQVTIRPTDLPGLHTDDQGRFGVTLYAAESDIGTDFITATATCSATIASTSTASHVPASCPADDPDTMGFEDGPAYRAAIAADRPVHWWHLDEGPSGPFIDSVVGTTGDRIGNVLPIPGSGTTHAALFDGAGSFVQIPEVRLDGEFTIEAWTYLCGLISNEDAIVGHGRGTPNVNFFEQHLRLFVGDAGDVVVANTAARPGTWEHWAIERDAAGTRIYRNGVLDASGAAWTDPLVLDEIGRGDVGVLHGMLDEVALYDAALTAAQLGAHVAAAGR